MTILQRLIEFAKANPGNTIDDILTRNDITDASRRDYWKHHVRKALEVGGTHRDLALNRVIVPTTGERSNWSQGLPQKDNLLKPGSSKALAAAQTISRESLPTNVKTAAADVFDTKLTGKAARAVAGYMTESLHEMRHSTTSALMFTKLLDEKDRTIATLEREVKALSEGLARERGHSRGGSTLVRS